MIRAPLTVFVDVIDELTNARGALVYLRHLELQRAQFAGFGNVSPEKNQGKHRADQQQAQEYGRQRTVFHISKAAENLLIRPWPCPIPFSAFLDGNGHLCEVFWSCGPY